MMTKTEIQQGSVTITKIVLRDLHECILPSSKSIEIAGYEEGTEATCRCGRKWILMKIMTMTRKGPPWRRRTLPNFVWNPEGITKD